MKLFSVSQIPVSIALLVAAVNAYATVSPGQISSCHAVMNSLDDPSISITTDIQIFSDKALITQSSSISHESYEQKSQMVEATVRAGLYKIAQTEASDENSSAPNPFDDSTLNLNEVEALVLHAMIIQLEIPQMQSGIDLTKVTSGRAFLLDENKGMGQAAVIEVKDADGNALGSFLGGFLVTPCQSI